ncbi:MAG: hypothetical protein L0G06_04705 [Enterobacterales bacterium]|nr:hypothetical protein [Enterobacterales bacterium]MDN6682524.1 hypothetical protein [Enterobacterales bacterium]
MKILLLGATGLVGSELLKLLEQDPGISKIYAPTRKPLPPSEKLVNPVADDLCATMATWTTPIDIAFCCLGTTRKDAGSDAAFRYVDYTLVVECGSVALKNGCQHYSVVSALGANPQSTFLYSRTKGEMEKALELQAWQHLTIVRPSMLQGDRPKPRLLEQISEPIFKLLPEKWKAVEASAVAMAMLKSARNPAPYRLQIIESEQIQKYSQ